MFDLIILCVAFVFITIAAICDFKTKEIPDSINFLAITIGVGLRLLYSIYSLDFSFLLYSLIGLAIAYALGCLMFYSGLWGGGDSKLLMAIGAFLGYKPQWSFVNNDFLAFLIDMLFIGALYSLVYCAVLAVKHKKQFLIEAKKLLVNYKFLNKTTFIVSTILFFTSFIFYKDTTIFLLFISLAVFCIFFFYLFLFIRAVENCCMIKRIKPELLTEGDWVAEDIIVNEKKICGKRDLGVSKNQIKQLIELRKKNKIKKVLLKTGIPFTPGWWFAYVFMIFCGNILLFF